MISRRTLLGAAGTGLLVVASGTLAGPVAAAAPRAGAWTGDVSANGWRIDPSAVTVHPVEGSAASLGLRGGEAAAVLLHVARRWHYEIAPLDTGEGGGVTGATTRRTVGADFESNHLSGTAIALHPAAYPLKGSEGLWPHQEAIVRDILADCDGTVVWGGDLAPVKVSHFHIAVRPGDRTLARVAARLDGSRATGPRTQTAGTVADPAAPARRAKSRRLHRAQGT
ncbi:hypothetical protein M2163_002261 [Streptomyces sp. SAI-135]|uniref:hypothetical protein n=1 Tax=unclassified Streptomyces TaxID=2593676 RepID=UPI0024736130|nr:MULTISPECIES: hypothetical protein [unclassified Streptomyces]MDH6520755.1 hypothetical protein [Streptomyces sp. SAI-090]MDH6552975.1 hypothetical protein [Streptomyces sp. SAI-041]MDH6572059.1 hypothetical protein [Streptomyces sp. SAI-117]MDH6615153.1 hypothetical protein [Streptomyces sp. SAI-135]